MSSTLAESIRVGSAFTLVGFAGAGAVALVKPDPSVGVLLVAAGLSAFISATAGWAFLVAPHPNASRRRAALAMTGSAVLGHFLTWAIFMVTASPQLYLANPSDLLKVPILALVFGLVSLVIIGWLTIPLGIGVGLFFLRRRGTPSAIQAGPA